MLKYPPETKANGKSIQTKVGNIAKNVLVRKPLLTKLAETTNLPDAQNTNMGTQET